MNDLELRQRCLRLALRAYGPLNMELEDVFHDFLAYANSNEVLLTALEMVHLGSKMPPILQRADRLAKLLAKPEPPPTVASKRKAVGKKRG